MPRPAVSARDCGRGARSRRRRRRILTKLAGIGTAGKLALARAGGGWRRRHASPPGVVPLGLGQVRRASPPGEGRAPRPRNEPRAAGQSRPGGEHQTLPSQVDHDLDRAAPPRRRPPSRIRPMGLGRERAAPSPDRRNDRGDDTGDPDGRSDLGAANGTGIRRRGRRPSRPRAPASSSSRIERVRPPVAPPRPPSSPSSRTAGVRTVSSRAGSRRRSRSPSLHRVRRALQRRPPAASTTSSSATRGTSKRTRSSRPAVFRATSRSTIAAERVRSQDRDLQQRRRRQRTHTASTCTPPRSAPISRPSALTTTSAATATTKPESTSRTPASRSSPPAATAPRGWTDGCFDLNHSHSSSASPAPTPGAAPRASTPTRTSATWYRPGRRRRTHQSQRSAATSPYPDGSCGSNTFIADAQTGKSGVSPARGVRERGPDRRAFQAQLQHRGSADGIFSLRA